MTRLFPAKDSVEFSQDDNYNRYRYSDSHKLMSGDCRLQIRVADRFIVTVESSLVRLNPFVEDEHGNCEYNQDDYIADNSANGDLNWHC